MWDNYFKRNASARPADPSLGRLYDAQQAGPKGLMWGSHAGTGPAPAAPTSFADLKPAAPGGLFGGASPVRGLMSGAPTMEYAYTKEASTPSNLRGGMEYAYTKEAATGPGLADRIKASQAARATRPENYQREAMEGLRAHVARLRDEQDPYGPGSTALRNYATQSDWFRQQTDQQREAAARAFGGPMVTAQDLSNLDSTGRAALVSGLAGIEAQRTANSTAWKQGRDNQIAGLYGQMLGAAGDPYRLEGLTHDNTYARLRNDSAEHSNTASRISNDRAMFELDQSRAVDPQVRREAQLRLDQLEQQINQAKQKGDWALVDELGKAAANVAKMGGFKWLGGLVGGIAGSLFPGAGTAAGATGGAMLGDWVDSRMG